MSDEAEMFEHIADSVGESEAMIQGHHYVEHRQHLICYECEVWFSQSQSQMPYMLRDSYWAKGVRYCPICEDELCYPTKETRKYAWPQYKRARRSTKVSDNG